MFEFSLANTLKNLHEIILQERAAAKSFEVDSMLDLTEEKEKILEQVMSRIEAQPELTPEEQALARDIHDENLRNAYFFWAALNWVRDSMSYIGEQIRPEYYGGSGLIHRGRNQGTLLSGRI
jgi:hypothetical protein